MTPLAGLLRLALVLLVILAAAAAGSAPRTGVQTAIPSAPIGSSRLGGPSVSGATGNLSARPSEAPPTKPSEGPHPVTTAGPRPVPRGPQVSVAPHPSATRESGKPSRTSQVAFLHVLRGPSSWFCLSGRSACTKGYDPACTCAAAGPAVRAALGPSWRGSVVTVSTARASVRVRLVDWCACPDGRVLDLFGATFAALAPLSAGLVDVRVSW